MKHAKLLSLGGEIITAGEADYSDYYGLMVCPNCHEPVFLRKGFMRKETEVEATFVHHKAVPEISICENRVGSYSRQQVEALASEAKNQRLRSLNISMWKYLKTNLAVNLSHWSYDLKFSKSKPILVKLNKLAYDALEMNGAEFFIHTLEQRAELLFNRDPLIAIAPGHASIMENFLKGKDRLQSLHVKVSGEALEVFFTAPMKEVRIRLLAVLCSPKCLQYYPDLMDEDTSTKEWKLKFISYLTLQVAFTFLTVDWLKVLQKD